VATSAVRAFVERFGDGDLIACATLQPGLEYVETSFGAWAFRRVGGVSAALGGPWCAPGDRAEMLRRFLRASRKPMMFYLRGPFAAVCARAGLHTASMGQDRVLDTAALLREPPKEVRGALRHTARHDFALREVSLSRLDASLRAQLDDISRDAIGRTDVGREITFLNRPWSSVDDGARRVFLLGQGDSILGFAVINAIWREGVVGAWLLDLLRFRNTKQWGVWWSVVHAISARLAAEGTSLAVGFAPLHRLAHPEGASRTLALQLDWMERRLSHVDYLRRLYALKAALPGHWEPRALASYTSLAPRVVQVFVEASGVRFASLLGPPLLDVLRRGFAHDAGGARCAAGTR